jgi:hypothetical protein
MAVPARESELALTSPRCPGGPDPEAAEITGLRHVMEVDERRAEEILDN